MVVPTTLFYKISQKRAGASVDSAITQLQPLPERDRKPSMVAAFSRNVEVMTAWPKFRVLCHAVIVCGLGLGIRHEGDSCGRPT